MKKMGKRVIQKHHLSYNPEVTVTIYKGEHQILTLMSRYTSKNVSAGFLRALRRFIKENRGRAKRLKK
jgi:hypothetical protein